jgi:FkbM family methyltransferase
MSACTGRRFPTTWQKRLSKLRFDLQQRLVRRLTVSTHDFSLCFMCHSPLEEMRVRSLLVKEAGTIAWLRQSLRAGDVFLDVGANIGLYSLVAASLVGQYGQVYAVEPHAINVMSLMQNVEANQFQDRVRIISTALHDRSGAFDFNYYSLEPGSAMSQLEGTKDGYDAEFVPVMTELKLATSIDDLIHQHSISAPHHIKIDVDGNELQVVAGMLGLLRSDERPRSIQIEMNTRYRDELLTALAQAGYRQTHKHYTAAGKAALARGEDAERIPYNAIYEPNPDSA